MNGRLEIAPAHREAFGKAAIEDVGALLARSTCVRDLPYRSNHQLVLGASTFHVKRHRHGWMRRLKRSPEAEGHDLLVEAEVRTAPLVAEGVTRTEGALAATEDLAPARPLDEVLPELHGAPRLRRAVLHDLARQVARLHDANLHHRDLYLNHVFVDPSAWPPEARLIDTERVARHRPGMAGRWVVKDLAQLRSSVPEGTVSRAELHRFLLVYLAARGATPDTWGAPLRTAIRAKVRRMRRHTPRTPVGEAARPRP